MLKLISILILSSVTLVSCYKPQILDISIAGRVIDENDKGVPNVTILIDRGTRESMWPVSYNRFDSVITGANGEYSYLITEYNYYYNVCCRVPSQYSTVEPYCKEVERTIIDSKTVPNIISFRLMQ
jgi:hypothetical protein